MSFIPNLQKFFRANNINCEIFEVENTIFNQTFKKTVFKFSCSKDQLIHRLNDLYKDQQVDALYINQQRQRTILEQQSSVAAKHQVLLQKFKEASKQLKEYIERSASRRKDLIESHKIATENLKKAYEKHKNEISRQQLIVLAHENKISQAQLNTHGEQKVTNSSQVINFDDYRYTRQNDPADYPERSAINNTSDALLVIQKALHSSVEDNNGKCTTSTSSRIGKKTLPLLASFLAKNGISSNTTHSSDTYMYNTTETLTITFSCGIQELITKLNQLYQIQPVNIDEITKQSVQINFDNIAQAKSMISAYNDILSAAPEKMNILEKKQQQELEIYDQRTTAEKLSCESEISKLSAEINQIEADQESLKDELQKLRGEESGLKLVEQEKQKNLNAEQEKLQKEQQLQQQLQEQHRQQLQEQQQRLREQHRQQPQEQQLQQPQQQLQEQQPQQQLMHQPMQQQPQQQLMHQPMQQQPQQQMRQQYNYTRTPLQPLMKKWEPLKSALEKYLDNNSQTNNNVNNNNASINTRQWSLFSTSNKDKNTKTNCAIAEKLIEHLTQSFRADHEALLELVGISLNQGFFSTAIFGYQVNYDGKEHTIDGELYDIIRDHIVNTMSQHEKIRYQNKV